MKTDFSKATPGPWHVDPVDLDCVLSNQGKIVAEISYPATVKSKRADDEVDANAALIAKAPLLPEMAEALRRLIGVVGTIGESELVCRFGHLGRGAVENALAVLAKFDAE